MSHLKFLRSPWAYIVGGTIIIGATFTIFLFQKAPLASKPPGTLKEIYTRSSDAANSPQDIVEFTDGSRLEGIGYDVTVVGTIPLPEGPPIYLFKSYSCRACEPDIILVVYSPHSRQKQIQPFPGQHVLMDENQKETPDQEFAAAYGNCEGSQSQLVMASKVRNVETESDWVSAKIKMTFDRKGLIQLTETPGDGFFDVKRLTESGCKRIEPEDRLDYL